MGDAVEISLSSTVSGLHRTLHLGFAAKIMCATKQGWVAAYIIGDGLSLAATMAKRYL